MVEEMVAVRADVAVVGELHYPAYSAMGAATTAEETDYHHHWGTGAVTIAEEP